MDERQIAAFNQLKEILIKKPILNIFNQYRETEIHTDASIDGYGAILLQKSPDDGRLHPIYYMSRKTTDAERKYSSYELEILAVIEALKKFRVYVLGIRFKLVTDCNAFTKTLEKKDLCTRVARWILFLQEYDYVVEHRAGSQMRHVDALSRYPVMIISENSTMSKMARVQSQDDDLKCIMEVLKGKQTYNDFYMKGSVLYKLIDDRELVVVPKSLQKDIIKQAHGRGHFGLKKTKELLLDSYYIPKLDEKIQSCINSCIQCLVVNRKRGKQEGELHPLPKNDVPFHTYHIDFLGPLESTSKQYKHILAVIDSFTKFCWLYPTKSTTAQDVITKLQAQSMVFGNPEQIITNRGAAFTSEDFKIYASDENIKIIAVTTGLPRANGQVERLNAVIIAVLAKLSINDPTKWYKHVPRVQQVINSTYTRSTDMTPFELLSGVKMRTKEDLQIKQLIEEEIVINFNEERQARRLHAKEQILQLQNENKKSFNARRKPAAKYEKGALVAIKRTQLGGGLKLKPKFLGPYRITKVKTNDTYDVEKEGESDGPIRTTTCAEYLKPWVTSDGSFETND